MAKVILINNDPKATASLRYIVTWIEEGVKQDLSTSHPSTALGLFEVLLHVQTCKHKDEHGHETVTDIAFRVVNAQGEPIAGIDPVVLAKSIADLVLSASKGRH